MSQHDDNMLPEIRFNRFEEVWQELTLDRTANFRRGSFPQPYGLKKWYDGPGAMPFVQVVDVNKDLSLVEKTKQQISRAAQSRSVFVEQGTVVVTLQGSIGRVAVLQYDAYVDRTLLIFREYTYDTNMHFWAYLIQRKFDIEKQWAPGGTIKTITKEALSAFKVVFPSFQEQTQIGSYFKSLDRMIGLHQWKHDKLVTLKQAMLQKMFPQDGATVPEIRFKGFERGWGKRKIVELFKVTRGDVLAATKTSSKKSQASPYPVYSSQTKNDGLMGYYHRYLFQDAITWTTDGANAGTVCYREGKFYSTNVNGVLLSDDGYANRAVAEALNQEAWRHVSHVGNPKLMNNVMGQIEIPIACEIEEQQKISAYFSKLDELISKHSNQIEKLKIIKAACLDKMFV